jgi:hypothetical protein
MGEKRIKLPAIKLPKRRRSLGRRVRRELRSLRRWSTLFLVIWGYFKLDEKRQHQRFPPGPSGPSS